MCSEKKRFLGRACLLSGGAWLLAVAGGSHAQASGDATLTSDYVWRGASQTREEPAVQAGFQFAHASGLYGSLWGSNVDYEPDNGARSEFDLALGWAGRIAPDWSLDLSVVRYLYPSVAELNWNEGNAQITWRDRYWFAVGHSDNAMASDITGTYTQFGLRHPLTETLSLEGHVGHYFLDSQFADSYTHGAASVIWGFEPPFAVRLTLHGTDSAAERLYSDMAGTRAEMAVQASF